MAAFSIRSPVLQQLAVATLLVALLALLGPWWAVYDLHVDEGFNLAKAAAVTEGHALYRETWSDQPPLLTYVLAGVHGLFPYSVAAARIVELAFSLVLVTSLFRVVLREEGAFAAWSAVLLLLSCGFFLELSVSVLVGLPAIALAMLSIDLATARARPRRSLALLAGGAFAAAVFTKAFAMIALPALIAAFWRARRRGEEGMPAAWPWALGGLALVAAAMLVAMRGLPFDQLLGTHMDARGLAPLQEEGGLSRLITFSWRLAPAPLAFALLFGLGAFWMRPGTSLLLPVLWILSAVLLLSTHHPLRDHQVLILIVPLCWLGGIGFKSLFRQGERLPLGDFMLGHRDRRIVAGSIALLGVGGAALTVEIARDLVDAHLYLDPVPTLGEQMARERLSLLAGDVRVLVTDRPIDAYRHGLSVPPELAVWSLKRLQTGAVTDDDVIAAIAAHPGAAVLLRRFEHSEDLLRRIGAIVPPVAAQSDRLSASRFRYFQTVPATTPLEQAILPMLPALMGEGIGGLEAAAGGRISRPSSVDPLPPGAIVARPPGSAQELGACLVAAARASGSATLAVEALGVGRALACAQTQGGGWREATSGTALCNTPGFRRPADGEATFDDGTVPSALLFAFDLEDLLDERAVARPLWLTAMIDRALSFVVETQRPDGSWPQSLEGGRYHGHATLNDDAMTGLIRILLLGHERRGQARLLEAARRGGDFLLRVQGEARQPAFAQQYDEGLPTAARAFEPAAYSTLETAFAINTLIDLHLRTGDTRYRDGAAAAARWLAESAVAPQTWARLHAIGTNRPLYARRDGTVVYRLEDLPADEQSRYRWQGGRETFPEIGQALDRIALLDQGADAVRVHDRRFRASALLADTPTARLWLDPAAATAAPGADGSTRAFALQCAGLVAAER
ncbi:pectate lyase [Aquibium sp. ELW1220]|uniref:pectate lyase n=1 Tax=Aquibium sp. ELW1220 TaxID=2976766 RepID=UPI0025B1600B|nr:pectate lyase [Aquibium sp. ELW1220]MDN2584042.1 glycosyltransferase family 39 protein [Aquibium sp. ELW1220]